MARDLQDAIRRAETAEGARAELQRRIENELEPEIARLRQERANEETAKGTAQAEARRASSARDEASANAEARQRRIEELERERDQLQARIDALDPTRIAEQEIEAQRLRQAEESKRTFWQQLKAAGIVGALVVAGFIAFYLLGVQMSWSTRGWLGSILVGLAFFAPQVIRLIETVAPRAAEHHRKISIGISAAIAALVVSLGLPKDISAWAGVLLWIGSFIGYGLLFQAAFESIRQLVREQTAGENSTRRDQVAGGYIVSFLVGLLGAGIYTFGFDAPKSAPSFLVHTLIGGSASGILYLLALLAYSGGVLVASQAVGLFEREVKRQRSIDKWLRLCKLVAGIVSVFVGWIVGSGYAYANGMSSGSSWAMAIGIGFGVTVVFYLIEGKVLEACFNRRYHYGILILLVLGAGVFAAGTAFLSFGKVYFEASRGPRFAEAQGSLIQAQNAYLSATEATCTRFASKEADPKSSPYSKAIATMRQAVELAGRASDRKELVESARLFQEGGSAAANCAGWNKGLLKDAIVHPEPTPSDLSSQYFFDTDIPGTQIHQGSARQALVAVCVIDFLIVILSLFGWLFSSKKRQDSQEEESNYGVVVSIREGGDCLVDIRGCPGVELNDVLNVEGGLGSLTVLDLSFFGSTACLARPASDKMQVTPGARVTLAN